MARLWLLLLCLSSMRSAPVSDDLVVLVGSVDSVPRGHSVVLPCWLSPPQSAEALEVRWYRGNFDTPIMHYLKNVPEKESLDPSYVGRVSYGLKDSTSGGLKAGDVSLKLVNIMIEDEGNYTCYVSSTSSYDFGTVTLRVTETGTQPLLSVTWAEDNMVNLSCHSEGWHPQPVLRWSDHKKDLTPTSLEYNHTSLKLHSVHSWLFVPSNSEISCSVGLSKKEEKESRIHLKTLPRQEKTESESSRTGWVAFGVLLIATAIASVVLGAFCIRKKTGKKSVHRIDQTGERETLLTIDPQLPTSFSEACKNYTNITFEKSTNEFLTVREKIVRDAANVTFPYASGVSCITAIKGMPGFSGGKHYWEVLLATDNTEIKRFWWVGVTTAAETPQNPDFSSNTSNRFWYLSSSPEYHLFSTDQHVVFLFDKRPQTVGVYLDYDSGELSFYNAGDKTLIGSVRASFSGEVFPLFNPGKGDAAPMTLLHKDHQSDSNNLTEENDKS